MSAVLDPDVFPFVPPAAPAPLVGPPPMLPARIPTLSSWFDPSTTDLIAFARYMQALVDGCDIHAVAFAPSNPYATIGAMRSNTKAMVELLARRLQAEERNLLLMDRLAFEAASEPVEPPYEARDAATGIPFSGEI